MEWWAAAFGGVIIVLAVAGAMAARGFPIGAILATIGIGLVMLGAAWPVWSAALMRGREERAARDRAEREAGQVKREINQPH
jgi:hypothetical protein